MMIFTEMYLSFVFIKFHALVPVTSTARNVGITNIRVVLSANRLSWSELILRATQVNKTMLAKATAWTIHVMGENGRIMEDHLGS